MAKQGAAIHMPQTELNAQSLAALLETLTRDACLAMAGAARGAGLRGANDAIAGILENAVLEKSGK
jgi:UDP-N-acetylglucosamine--N-acetylmuramyl-(pentapeptide) pyrophosphoryl-undecaprenol N-acetylglucosamine transferase